MKFLALDFETANLRRDSACALGLARVENSKIVDKKALLIRPPYKLFLFTYLHGISWEDVEDAQTFKQQWGSIKSFFRGIDFAVAHNAPFDRDVLHACCNRYKIKVPEIDFKCTVKLSRQILGIYPTNLPAVCNKLNIPLNHHDALSDTLACAKIMIKILKESKHELL